MDNEKNPLLFLTELQDFIEKRHEEMPEGSYTTSLFKDGLNRMAQTVGEEARIEDLAKELQVRHDPNWHKH